MGRVINRLMNRVIDRTSGRKAGGPTDMRVLTTAEGDIVTLRDSVNGTLNEIYIYGKSIQNGTPTPDAPVDIESFEGAEVACYGGNLLDYDSFKKYVESHFIIRGTCAFDGESFTLTANDTDCYTYHDASGPKFNVLPNTTYVLSWDASNDNTGSIYVFFNGAIDSRMAQINNDHAKSLTFTTGLNDSFVTFRFGVRNAGKSITYSNIRITPTTATAYEPYKTPSVLPIPYTLRGLKVASGGNYTDSEGQQWVSDYVHLWRENGVVKGERVEACWAKSVTKEMCTADSSKPNFINRYPGWTKGVLLSGFYNHGIPAYDQKYTAICSINDVAYMSASDVVNASANCQALGNNTGMYMSKVGGFATTQEAADYYRELAPFDVVGRYMTPRTATIPTDQATAMLNALKTYKPTTNIIGSKPCGLSVQYKAQAPGEVVLYGSSPLVLPHVGGSALKSLYLKGGEITQDGVPTPDSPKPILIGGKELRVNDAGVAYVDGQEVMVSGGNIANPKSRTQTNANGGKTILDGDVLSVTLADTPQYAMTANSGGGLTFDISAYDIPDGTTLYARFSIKTNVNRVRVGVWLRDLSTTWYIGPSTILYFNINPNTWESIVVPFSRDVRYQRVAIIAHLGELGNGAVAELKDFQISTTATDYEPYKEPQRIPIPLLIGTDEADITSGEVTRKYATYIVRGTEKMDLTDDIYSRRFSIVIPYKSKRNDLTGKTNMYEIVKSMGKTTPYGASFFYDYSFLVADNYSRFADTNAFRAYIKGLYDSGNPLTLTFLLDTPTTETLAPQTTPLIKPTSVLTSYASEMKATYKAVKKQWWEYIVGLDHDIDLTDKNVTLEALVSIISNSNPKSAIVIALPSDAYKKCVSGGGWNGTISAELAKKPLVTLALK